MKSNTHQNQLVGRKVKAEYITPERCRYLLSHINPAVNHSISYCLPSISANINYNQCGYSCYPQLNS